MELIQIKVNDNRNIVGIYESPTEKSDICILMLHGYTGNKIEPHRLFVKMSRRFNKIGLNTFRIDFWGSGESDGDFKDMTLNTEIEDADAAVSYLRNNKKIKQIFVLGLSMGGCIASYTAKRNQLDGIMLWSPLAIPKLSKKLLETFQEIIIDGKKYFDDNGNVISPAFIESLRTADPVKELADTDIPVLLIHSKKDETLTVDHYYAYKNRLINNDVAAYLLPEGTHTFASYKVETEVINKTSDWILKFIIKK